jgi:uncharacterized repeat protein (TIGR02543 family)
MGYADITLYAKWDCDATCSVYHINYDSNGASSGSVPSDTYSYNDGDPVTVLGNTGSLERSGYTFAGWNTAADASGTTYSANDSFNIGAADVTLYAKWTLTCNGLKGGAWVRVPGDPIYSTSDFCAMKYSASDVSKVPTAIPGSNPWVNINQTSAIATCATLGSGYHLVTNPEWMTVAANIAAQGSNWSGGSVGSGTLSRGHSDNSPTSACSADASDANGWVQTNCTGQTQGALAFNQRRTQNLSNGEVIWDIGGNVWQWIDYNNASDKPTPANGAWHEFTAMTGTATTPMSHLVPLNSAQSWWDDTWNSAESIGKIYPGTNGSGGALLRGARWDGGSLAGPFAVNLSDAPSATYTSLSFRCVYQPPQLSVTYHANGADSGSVPTDSTSYAEGQTVTVFGNTGSLARTGIPFVGWNTKPDRTGTTYTANQTFKLEYGSVTLFAKWAFAGGDGTEGNPYLVESPEDLYLVRNDLTAYYKQIADIDLSGYTNWEPIGDNTTPFTGSYDGDGYTIDNMTIDRATTHYVGLFGVISSASLSNVGITNADVVGGQYAGAMVGRNLNGTIVNSYTTGEVEGIPAASSGGVGGLVGENNGGTISYCYSTVNVTIVANGTNAGGLVGRNYGDISKCYAAGDVNYAEHNAGGLVGWNGGAAPSTITDCYATGNVTGETSGGLVAFTGNGSTIENSYSVGMVTGSSVYVGGLVGYRYSGTTTNSYWDTETSMLETSGSGTGKTTTEMMQQATFSGWDFTNTWEITEGVTYPTLR